MPTNALLALHDKLKTLRDDFKRTGLFGYEIDDHIYTLIEVVIFKLDELGIEYE